MTEKKLLSKNEFLVRWVDLDAYNHLNNARYYDFMTEARCKDFFQFKDECAFIVAENSCKFKMSVSYPAKLIIEQYVQNISIASFELIYIFKLENSERIVAEGFTKMFCLDFVRKKPIKIPSNLVSFFNPTPQS